MDARVHIYIAMALGTGRELVLHSAAFTHRESLPVLIFIGGRVDPRTSLDMKK